MAVESLAVHAYYMPNLVQLVNTDVYILVTGASRARERGIWALWTAPLFYSI